MGLDFLSGCQHGAPDFNGVRSIFESPFFAVEPNLQLKYKFSQHSEIGISLQARFIWMSSATFYSSYGRRQYSTDLQKGIALLIRIVY